MGGIVRAGGEADLSVSMLAAVVSSLRACSSPHSGRKPAVGLVVGFVGLWEAAGADDAVDMFEGTGPGCMGAAVQPGTSAAPANWAACAVALEKYYQGTCTLEPQPTWKREYEMAGLDLNDIK
eukprot:jgi/Tetstr1/422855/TSEL_013646.t1